MHKDADAKRHLIVYNYWKVTAFCVTTQWLTHLKNFTTITNACWKTLVMMSDSEWRKLCKKDKVLVSGTGYCFRSISWFICYFISFFVSSSARLRENGWTDLHEIFRECAEWPWDDLITLLDIDNSEKPRDAAMRNTGRGLLCFSTTACLSIIYCNFCKKNLLNCLHCYHGQEAAGDLGPGTACHMDCSTSLIKSSLID